MRRLPTKIAAIGTVRPLHHSEEPLGCPAPSSHARSPLITGHSAAESNGSSATGSPTQHSRHAYLFLLQLDAGQAFMGCTPEKLFKIQGDQLTTEAIAGTRPRGESAEADRQLVTQAA